jgi:hypothetical protein
MELTSPTSELRTAVNVSRALGFSRQRRTMALRMAAYVSLVRRLPGVLLVKNSGRALRSMSWTASKLNQEA